MAAITKTLASNTKSQHIRPFDPRRDMGSVADLVELCFAETLDESGRNYLKRMRYAAKNSGMLGWAAAKLELSGVPASGYVWEQDGQVVGNASMIPFVLGGQRNYLIANVAVHPDYRRRGIAHQITIRALEHARARHAPSVWLHVRQENDGAVALYQELGFQERARRTTWIGSHEFIPGGQLSGIALKSSRRQGWSQQRKWLLESYPREVAWHIPFRANILQPGFWGAMQRVIENTAVVGWSAYSESRLLGTVTWQSFTGPTDYLWLAFPLNADESVVRVLLEYACQRIPSKRRIALDYPADRFKQPFLDAGFNVGQTLIWMELEF